MMFDGQQVLSRYREFIGDDHFFAMMRMKGFDHIPLTGEFPREFWMDKFSTIDEDFKL